MNEFESNELESTLLESGNDLANESTLDTVRLAKSMVISSERRSDGQYYTLIMMYVRSLMDIF